MQHLYRLECWETHFPQKITSKIALTTTFVFPHYFITHILTLRKGTPSCWFCCQIRILPVSVCFNVLILCCVCALEVAFQKPLHWFGHPSCWNSMKIHQYMVLQVWFGSSGFDEVFPAFMIKVAVSLTSDHCRSSFMQCIQVLSGFPLHHSLSTIRFITSLIRVVFSCWRDKIL